jgi:large subunit ribosomal protein L15
MRLHNLPKTPGLKSRKRIGRGEGGGRGKTSGRGHKGQRSRTGFSQRPGFESGHIPLYRKLPKRGFSNAKFRVDFDVVNVGDLERVEGEVADRSALVAAGLLRRGSSLYKILGEGELSRKLSVSAHKFSATAKAKIEAAGGEALLLSAPAEDPSGEDPKAAEAE